MADRLIEARRTIEARRAEAAAAPAAPVAYSAFTNSVIRVGEPPRATRRRVKRRSSDPLKTKLSARR